MDEEPIYCICCDSCGYPGCCNHYCECCETDFWFEYADPDEYVWKVNCKENIDGKQNTNKSK